MTKYRVTLRFMSEDYDVLKMFVSNKNVNYEIFKQGDPIRPKSSNLAKKNVLIINILRTDSIEEIEQETKEMILKLDLGTFKSEMKKEIIISSINDTDQFGFELSNEFLQIIANNKLTLCVSGVFI